MIRVCLTSDICAYGYDVTGYKLVKPDDNN